MRGNAVNKSLHPRSHTAKTSNGLHKKTAVHNHGLKHVHKVTQGKKKRPYFDEQLSTFAISNKRDGMFNCHPACLVSVGYEGRGPMYRKEHKEICLIWSLLYLSMSECASMVGQTGQTNDVFSL